MRQVALAIETTGLYGSDRIIEIAGVEMIDGNPTGNAFNVMINPPKNITAGASQMHHLLNADVARYNSFSDVADKFLGFIKEAEVLVHYAPFSKPLINNELKLAGKGRLEDVYAKMTDTWAMAKKVYPGLSNNLDDVAIRGNLLREKRTDRQGMRDARLLADVYGSLVKLAQEKGVNLNPASKKLKAQNGSRLFSAPAVLPSEDHSAQRQGPANR